MCILQLATIEVCFVCEVVICAPQAALGGTAEVHYFGLNPLISHNLVIRFNNFQEPRGTNYVYITCVAIICL